MNIVSAREEKGKVIIDLKNLPADVAEKSRFTMTVYEQKSYCMYEKNEGYYIIAMLPIAEAIFSRNVSVYVMLFMEILIFVCLFILIYYLIKQLVVNNIRRVNESLSMITNGNLDVTVDVRANEEFASLSDDINSTVITLKKYIAEAAARIDEELEFAKSIQHSALPSVFPPFPNRTDFSIFATMDAAKEVGGDFYDFYFTGNNEFAFLAADVSGKGIPAAMFMMRAKTLIKGYAESGVSVERILTLANEKLCEGNDAEMFVTAWIGKINLETGTFSFSNAGHNPPLIRRDNGKYEYLKSASGFVLGGMEGITYKKNELQLSPGDMLFLYTDGVTEAADSDSRLYGEERLKSALNGIRTDDPDTVCAAVKDDVSRFVGSAPQFDDITMLSFCWKGERKTNQNELTLDAVTENIEQVTQFVNGLLEAADCPPKAQMQIDIAIDELFGNIANYAYNPDTGPATVRVEVENDPLAVILTLIDNGKPFDPLATADPDITKSAEEREIGGLGIYMVKKTMDKISYEYRNGQNILTIKKKI